MDSLIINLIPASDRHVSLRPLAGGGDLLLEPRTGDNWRLWLKGDDGDKWCLSAESGLTSMIPGANLVVPSFLTDVIAALTENGAEIVDTGREGAVTCLHIPDSISDHGWTPGRVTMRYASH
ncbi:hypothetical protein COO72_12350 [Bifidobacterium callitrichos]|nr:hypothetical protein COO72_12350 [Bifidobacterium callitrichos]